MPLTENNLQSEYHALQEKLQSVQNELQQLSSKNVELQRTLETERAAWAQDKRTLEDTIVDMTTSEQGTESERTAHANEIRQLEERAKAAEDRYGREVLVHADAIKTVDALRQQVGKAEASARSNLTAVETAQVKLAASEASWKQQKDALDKELSDLQVRSVLFHILVAHSLMIFLQQQGVDDTEWHPPPAP